MARLTSEIAAGKVGRYDLILIASRRTRELNRGWRPLVQCENSTAVTALREIEAGLIGREYLAKPQNLHRKETPDNEDK